MAKGYFNQLTEQEQKEFKQRQVLIEEAIEKGSFQNRREVKAWMKDFFNLNQPVSGISTEYTLTSAQKKLFYKWLMYFTGKGPQPYTNRPKARISKRQLYRVDELKKSLGWEDQRLYKFVEHQIGKKKMVSGLWKYEATKLITGMERILAEQPFKIKE